MHPASPAASSPDERGSVPPGSAAAHHERVQFATTHWSLVLSAGQNNGETARRAWELLAQRYWYPLYAFARRSGASPEDAADAAQSFFAHLLATPSLTRASPERGRFRTFLLAAFKHHLSNARRRANSLKRGGQIEFVPLDLGPAEDQYAQEPADPRDPTQLYDRRWAMMILERCLGRLREEVVARSGGLRWERLQPCLEGGPVAGGYSSAATALGLSEPAVRSAVRRLRVRLGELVRAELSELVTNAAELEVEFRHWGQVLRGG